MRIPANDSVSFYELAPSSSSVFVQIDGPANMHGKTKISSSKVANDSQRSVDLSDVKYSYATSILALLSIVAILIFTISAVSSAVLGSVKYYLVFTFLVLVGLGMLWVAIRQARSAAESSSTLRWD